MTSGTNEKYHDSIQCTRENTDGRVVVWKRACNMFKICNDTESKCPSPIAPVSGTALPRIVYKPIVYDT